MTDFALDLPLIHAGKVRRLYALPDGNILMVATDAISAYDHVLATPIPDKGAILNQLSLWWFDQLDDVPNHVLSTDVPDAVQGRAVVVEIDPTDRKGALSSDDGESIAIAAHIALAERIPLVGYIASSGADIVEGMAALHGWGLAARALADCSGIVPVVLAVTGPAVSGPALLLGLADLVVMTADSYAFVSGPTMVTEFTGVRIDSNELGGAHVHARHTGAASIVVDDVEAAQAMIELLLAFLPAHADEAPPRWPTDDPADRLTPEERAPLEADYEDRKSVV